MLDADSTDGGWSGAQCYYFDDKSNTMTIEDNTGYGFFCCFIFSNGQDCDLGLFVHNAQSIKMHRNTMYNMRDAGILFSNDTIPGTGLQFSH